MLNELRHGIAFTLATMLLFGGAYHVGLWAIGRVAFPAQVEGSLVRRADGAARAVAAPRSVTPATRARLNSRYKLQAAKPLANGGRNSTANK